MITLSTAVLTFLFQIQTQAINSTKIAGQHAGSYYTLVQSQYDPASDETFGVFLRYEVDYTGDNGRPMMSLIHGIKGHATDDQLRAAEVYDPYITMVK